MNPIQQYLIPFTPEHNRCTRCFLDFYICKAEFKTEICIHLEFIIIIFGLCALTPSLSLSLSLSLSPNKKDYRFHGVWNPRPKRQWKILPQILNVLESTAILKSASEGSSYLPFGPSIFLFERVIEMNFSSKGQQT